MRIAQSQIHELPAVWSRPSTCLFALVIAILIGVYSQDVSAQTASYSDPSGDTDFKAPGYQDILRAEITKESDGFVVRMEVAAAVPANPPLSLPAQNEMWWLWAFDLDPATTPSGYPNAPGSTLPGEIHARIVWNGTSFSGEVIDRRPLLNGGEAIITPVAFSHQGSTLEVHVPSAVVGNPASFTWGVLTSDWSGPVGTGGYHFVDLIPGRKTWP